MGLQVWGTSWENFHSIQITSDGGYILGGYSNSDSSGNKTQNSRGGSDYWIIKIDSNGNKQWDKRFGGTDTDLLFKLQKTNDKGYILGGFSTSDSSGDKTQSSWGNSFDYWILKTDSMGNKKWDKRFGGIGLEELFSLEQTSDNGYISGGFSNSDSSGDKTQISYSGSFDFWIIKIDSIGNKQWDKRFGGSGEDANSTVLQTNGGYILGGSSDSDSSGDKTQPSRGLHDYWILKVDLFGNKQWDKRYGGSNDDYLTCLKQTPDEGFILGGHSISDSSGDKSQSTWGGRDYWIVKIDSLGNEEWNKDFGGKNNEELYRIEKTSDNGYLLSGDSYSNISGDKTENNMGQEQTWIVKIDSSGNKQWDKTILTSGHDEYGESFQISNGCFIIANRTDAGIGGYKTQPNWDSTNLSPDYWIVKFCDTTSATSITQLDEHPITFFVSPNPFTSEISITIQKQHIYKASFTIKNILGQTVFEKTKHQISNSNYQTNLDLGFLPNGIYLLEVFIDGERMVKKIVKE